MRNISMELLLKKVQNDNAAQKILNESRAKRLRQETESFFEDYNRQRGTIK